jgi:hypothetical protein
LRRFSKDLGRISEIHYIVSGAHLDARPRMSRANEAGTESAGALTPSAKILASAHSCARRAQVTLEGLDYVSSLLPLTAAGVGIVDSYLTRMMMERTFVQPAQGMTTALTVRLA